MYRLLVSDLRAECEALDRLVSGLDAAAAARQTKFFAWTIRDEIEHLHQVDGFGLAAMESDAAFAEVFISVRADQARGIELSGQARRDYAHLSWPELLGAWRAGWREIAARLDASNSKDRIMWFGPDMSRLAFAAARQMEVWAHGQDVLDTLGLSRPAEPRIRHICELGVRTFGWSFVNRDLDVPKRPTVALVGPADEDWRWPGENERENEGADAGLVSGTAHDFALVVTQRRNAADTGLVAQGEPARHWLEFAQCFAGAPQDHPPPGSHLRKVRSRS